ncbi:MAG: MBL fold metallo-hydrolase [Pirellulales bacterium]|nr:MBL fold metallo-hydrolase [Pirellulales bacterium]
MPLPQHPKTVDVRGELVFLGTGTSIGVPVVGCDCKTCSSDNPRNWRTRCGLVLGLAEGNLLIDTPTDLRSQLLREGIGVIHAVAYTHSHADHIFGLDDVRAFPFYLGHDLPIYCEESVKSRIHKSFDYAFDPQTANWPRGALPKLEIRTIDETPFTVLGAEITPIRLHHGRMLVLGFRVGNIAYCTDTNRIPDQSWPLLEDLDVLILDCLRDKPHPTHFTLTEAIETAERVNAKQTLFTHIAHELEHEETNAALPKGMEMAYDGLKIPLT